MDSTTAAPEPRLDEPATADRRMHGFERLLTLWVFLCMVAGITLGRVAPGLVIPQRNRVNCRGWRREVCFSSITSRIVATSSMDKSSGKPQGSARGPGAPSFPPPAAQFAQVPQSSANSSPK